MAKQDSTTKDMLWIINTRLPASGSVVVKVKGTTITCTGSKADLRKLMHQIEQLSVGFDYPQIINQFGCELNDKLIYTKK